VEENDTEIEGYHVHIGGGYGEEQGIARELFRDVKADDAPRVIARMLERYLATRADAAESFHAFTKRHEIGQLKTLFS
jgi:ferredoxin-nitrite reductase